MTVLDTNVISELMRVAPSPAVLAWFAKRPAASLFTTTITVAEILYGMELLPKGKRRSALESAANITFQEDFAGRLLPFDLAAALLYPQIVAARQKAGRPASQFDAQIVSICRSRGAALATCNTSDFEDCGVELLNPWMEN